MTRINREPLTQNKTFIGQNKPQCFVSNISIGSAVMCTAQSPDKTTGNEDSAALIPVNSESAVFVIADGAGGMRGGKQASAIAIETLIKVVSESVKSNTDIRNAILNGIEQANAAIINLGIGAGSTISVVEQNGMTIRIYHVGDSEVIVMGQRGRLIHQTIPHSPIGYAVEAGLIEPEEALHHEERHIVSNILGSNVMHIAIGPEIKLAKYDTVLLSSDGLTDNLSIDTIVNSVRKGRLSAAVRKLFKTTLKQMESPEATDACKPDDLTIIGFRQYPIGHPSKVTNSIAK